MSGEALKRTQSGPPLETAIEDCVRRRAFMVPLRTPSQLGQLQFHWGKPPPAADPKTRILTVIVLRGRKTQGALYRGSRVTGLAVGNIHRGFKTKANLGVFRFGPHKGVPPTDIPWNLSITGREKAISENAGFQGERPQLNVESELLNLA